MKLMYVASALAIATVGFASNVLAQQVPAPITQVPVQTLPEALDAALGRNSGTYSTNTLSLTRQVDLIFGVGSYATSFRENEVTEDARLLHVVYLDALEQQAHSSPLIRTRDLPNPFSASLMTYQPSSKNVPIAGSELISENLPAR